MPELPEVETVVRNIGPEIMGREFSGIESFFAKSIEPDLGGFEEAEGKKVLSVARRGKFINIFLEDDFVITIHLRMTGRLIVAGLYEERLKYERSRLNFGEISLRFCDLRKFGRIWLNKIEDYELATGISRLGVEPLSDEFDLASFEKMLEGRRGNVKSFLLNQGFVSGIGNIYADESLFYAGVRPERNLDSLRPDEIDRLHRGIKRSLRQGVKNCGTSFSDFVNAFGEKGRNQEILYVYNRGGQKCLRCETILNKTKVASRGTVYCSKCQK